MSPSIYDILRTFNSENKFDGSNYDAWVTELEMSFVGHIILEHITGTAPSPTDAAAIVTWAKDDASARSVIYKTIKSNDIIRAHFKNSTPPQTANAVWTSIKADFQKDSRARRFEYKRRLYNPIHDNDKPVSTYIQDIVDASESLSTLGHKPPNVDVVDSILMNLHSDFSIVRTLLTAQQTEPTLAVVKKTLTDQEDTRTALDPDAAEQVRAMYGRAKKKGKKEKDGDDNSPNYEWLNPRNTDACHRCGLPGHRSSRCIADMPQKIKDKIIREAKERRRKRTSSDDDDDETAAAARHHSHVASDTESDSDSDSDGPSVNRKPVKQVSDMTADEFAHFIDTTARRRDAKKDWKALKARLQI